MNKLPSNRKRAVERFLCKKFPVFVGDPRPLEIGIRDKIQKIRVKIRECKVLAEEIDTYLAIYTRGYNYNKALLKFTARFKLNGKPSGFVSAAQRERAAERLKELNTYKEKLERQGKWRSVKKPRPKVSMKRRKVVAPQGGEK